MNRNNWKKNIILFLTSQAITLFGSSLVQYAITWYVAKETKSGVMVTMMIICGFLPQVIISLFAGVWADRYSRKLLIVAADGGIAAATLLLAFIMMRITDFYPALLVISVLRSAGAGIQTPAVNATVPQIVPQEKLMRVNGINGSVQSAINLIAPMAAGALLSWGEIYYVMFIDIVTAAIGITVLLCVPLEKHAKALERGKSSYFADLREGVSYVSHNKFLKRLLLVSTAFCFLLAPAALLNVLYVTRIFGDSYWYLTLNEMSFFVGMLAGGLVLGAWGGFSNRLKTIGLGGAVFGITVLLITLTDSFVLYLIIMVITGLSTPFNSAPLTVIVQEKVDENMQGRVFSLSQIVMGAVMPLAMLIFGPLSDLVPIKVIMGASGAAMTVLVIVLFRWKSFYRAGEKTASINPEAAV